MPENEFENEVQKKLESFTLNPSNELWGKVALAIGNQKKRRRKAGLYFIIFCFLLLGSLFMPVNKIYFLQNGNDNMQSALGKSITVIDKINTATNNRRIADKTLAGKTITVIDKINTATDEKRIADKTLAGKTITASDKINTATDERRIADKTLAGKTFNAIDKISIATNEKFIAVKIPSAVTKKRSFTQEGIMLNSVGQTHKRSVKFIPAYAIHSLLSNNKKIHSAGKKYLKISQVAVGAIEDTTMDTIGKNKKYTSEKNNSIPPNSAWRTDTVTTFCISKKVFDTAEINAASTEKNTIKTAIPKKSKWILEIAAIIGKAATDNIFLSSNNNSAYNYASPVTGNIGGQPTVYQPSIIKSGFGFSLGASATKKIGLKITLGLGINYRLLTNRLLVGRQTIVSNVINYNVGNLKNYRNAFHFIELPVTLQYPIFCIKKRPVLLEGGISIAQLFYTNALQFNFTQGNYYTDNAIFNKTIIGFSAGISYKINGSKSAPLLLGAYAYYSATNMTNTGLYTKSKYSFAGISLKKSLTKSHHKN